MTLKTLVAAVATVAHGPVLVAFIVLVSLVVVALLVILIAAVFADGPGVRTRALLRAWGQSTGRMRPPDTPDEVPEPSVPSPVPSPVPPQVE